MAAARAARASEKLDEYWYHLRVQRSDLPGKHLLRMASVPAVGFVAAPSAQPANVAQATGCVRLSEAVAIYLRLKGNGRPATFHRAAERSCGYAIDVCGDKDITAYTKGDANAFRDDLVKRDLTGSSVSRIFGTVKSVVNFAASESGVTLINPFAGVYFDRAAGVEDREPIPLDFIRDLQLRCRKHDDDLRRLVALVSDKGLRLAEAAG